MQQRAVNNTYSFKNEQAAGQNIYYRIKAADNTGAVKYSNTVKLIKGNNGSGAILKLNKLYPNPVTDVLNFAFNAPVKGKAVYSVTTTAGQNVWNKKETITAAGSYTNTEDIRQLKPGSYIFTVMLNGEKVSQPFIKR